MEALKVVEKMEVATDTVSRQLAIKEIKSYIVDPDKAVSEYEDNVFNYNAGLKSAVQAVADLPPAQPEPRWIPCSERLPEKIGEYLCQESQGFRYCETYLGSGKWRIADYYSGKVVAWMPLPEPYREESEE